MALPKACTSLYMSAQSSHRPRNNMAELVANCPRCKAQSITFDVKAFNFLEKDEYSGEHYEVFGICRRCSRGTIFVVWDA